MRVLVAGGAGFVGSHLSECLAREGHQVCIADNLSTGNWNNVQHLVAQHRVELLEHDVADRLKGQYDLIFNMACPASPPHYQSDPLKTMRTSVYGTDNLLALATSCGALFVQASTSEVYGDAMQHPQQESYWGNVNPIGIRACYDEGKRAAETLCFDYARTMGTRVRVARIFNTYGPRMRADDGRVVSNFIVQALRNEPLTVYGDGRQTRSFCYVDDLVDGFMRLSKSGNGVTGPVNLGNPGEFTMLELAEQVIGLTGSTSAIVHHRLPEDDPKQRRPNIDLAWSQLQWKPRVSLREGLAKTIAHFSGVLAAKSHAPGRARAVPG